MTIALFNEAKYLSSLADDEELAHELLDAFFDDSPKRIANLQKAIAAGDASTASKLAHSLKGMCGVVRAERLSELAFDMERLAKDGHMDKVETRFDAFTESHKQAVTLMQAYLDRN